jgi:hypothetical protein
LAQTLERARSWVLETSYYLGHPLSLKIRVFSKFAVFFYRKFIGADHFGTLTHERPPIATKAILYIIDGKFCTNIRLVDDRVMDTIMRIYSRSVSFFSAERILQAFSESYVSILPERLNVKC